MQKLICSENLKGDIECKLTSIFSVAEKHLNSDDAMATYMCWRFSVRCVDILALTGQNLIRESIITNYTSVVYSLGMVNAVSMGSQQQQHNNCESCCICHLRDRFNAWFKNLRLMFEQWKSNLLTGDIVAADILTLKLHRKYALAGSVCKVDISEEVVEEVFGKFKSQFSILKELMLPAFCVGNVELRLVSLMYWL